MFSNPSKVFSTLYLPVLLYLYFTTEWYGLIVIHSIFATVVLCVLSLGAAVFFFIRKNLEETMENTRLGNHRKALERFNDWVDKSSLRFKLNASMMLALIAQAVQIAMWLAYEHYILLATIVFIYVALAALLNNFAKLTSALERWNRFADIFDKHFPKDDLDELDPSIKITEFNKFGV